MKWDFVSPLDNIFWSEADVSFWANQTFGLIQINFAFKIQNETDSLEDARLFLILFNQTTWCITKISKNIWKINKTVFQISHLSENQREYYSGLSTKLQRLRFLIYSKILKTDYLRGFISTCWVYRLTGQHNNNIKWK